MTKIFIVEDEEKIRSELSLVLNRYGYKSVTTNDFENIIEQILSEGPELILLDINLPFFDGFQICREIRKTSDVPIIAVTSRNSEFDELLMMNIGADDYVTKPFNTQILLAKISAILRRTEKSNNSDKVVFNNLVINGMTNTIKNNETNVEIDLTKNEMKILKLLTQNNEKIVSRDDIMNYLWQSNAFVDENTLSVNVNRLRKRLEEIGFMDVIETKRGLGYIFICK